MDQGQLVVAASEMAPNRCVPHTRQVALLGPPFLYVRLCCEVCFVLDSDYQHPFINWIGVATDVAKTVASDLLMYHFVRSL